MRTKRTLVGAVAAASVCLMLSSTRAAAHHAFAAEFDANQPVTLRGTVTRVEWINPHSWIHVDVKSPDGTVQRWMIEGGPPNSLLRRGFTKNSLLPGAEIFVDGFQAKDRSRKANGRDVTFQNGSKLFLGSSGTGAPKDGKDPSDKK